MTAAIIIKDPASGSTLFDSTIASARIVGSSTVSAGQSGSVSNVAFESGTPFCVMYPYSINPDVWYSYTFPTYTFNGATFSWTTGTAPTLFVYGVYAGTTGQNVTSGQIGFRAVNGSSVTQIDHTYSNLALASKQSISLGLRGSTTITVPGKYPVVAYRGTGLISVHNATDNGDGTWTLGILGSSAITTAGTVYVFDIASKSSLSLNSSIGLIIRNRTTGEVNFDSRLKYANVKGVGTITNDVPAYPTTTTLGQDTLAVIISPGFFTTQSTRSTTSSGGGSETITTTHIYISGAGVNGTTLSTGGIQELYDGEIVSDVYIDGTYILIDVTGF